MSPWTEKHRPKTFLDVKGQNEAVRKVKLFVEEFRLGNLTKRAKKAIILHGPPGVGKTTLAYVASNETSSEIFELNASDLRNKDKLNTILKPAIQQQSLIKKGKIILVDEVDGISGYYDRGGMSELLKLIDSTPYPIIITANDIWNKKFSALRRKSNLVQLKEIEYKIIKDILINILKKQNLFINNDLLTTIAIKSKGDLRAAINDIQAAAHTTNLTPEEFDERNKELDIFNALKKIFKEKPDNNILRTFDSVKMPIDEISLWLEENLPSEYQGEELAKAINYLSKADLFKGRIYKKQYWRFLVYQNIFLSYGISSARNQSQAGFTKYKRPERILKIWLNNQRTAKKKSITEKYSQLVHVGKKRALREFPIIKQIINSKPEIANELKLNEEEIEYLER